MVTKWFSFLKSPLKNSIIGIVGLALIAPLCVMGYCFFLVKQWEALDEKRGYFEKKTNSLLRAKQQREQFAEDQGLSDPNFIQNYVEPLQLLKEEVEVISKLKSFTYEPIQKRLSFLAENKIKFIDGKLVRPVEVNSKDIKQILSLIEGANPLKPPIIIKKFSFSNNMLDMEIEQMDCHEKN